MDGQRKNKEYITKTTKTRCINYCDIFWPERPERFKRYAKAKEQEGEGQGGGGMKTIPFRKNLSDVSTSLRS